MTATRGTLTFAAGGVRHTVSVPVLKDSHDEGTETLTLTLRHAAGAALAGASATGTITNSDLLPRPHGGRGSSTRWCLMSSAISAPQPPRRR